MVDTATAIQALPSRAPCFISYAHDDLVQDEDQNLRKFLQHLDAKLRKELELGSAPAIFFDSESIPPAAQWRPELVEALQATRVFVPVYSSTFFTRSYCGKEWGLFQMRQSRYHDVTPPGTPRPDRILPLLWKPHDFKLPALASEVHYRHDRFGANYAKYGLSKLMELTKFQKDVDDFAEAFCTELVRLIRTQPDLPQVPVPPNLEDLPNAFTAPAGQPTARATGPRSAQFLFVVAKAGEMETTRKPDRRNAYDPQDGRYWKPFHPPSNEDVGLLALDALRAERLHYDVLPLDDAFIGRLLQAQSDSNIVIVIIDPWTLQLERYQAWMRQLDNQNFWNSAILFPWDEADDHTRTMWPSLSATVMQIFVNKGYRKDPDFFLDEQIRSEPEFRHFLAITLAKVRNRILQVVKPRSLPPGAPGPSTISSVPGSV
jgi:FxsC-like protein